MPSARAGQNRQYPLAAGLPVLLAGPDDAITHGIRYRRHIREWQEGGRAGKSCQVRLGT
jgi:hypothetical protein